MKTSWKCLLGLMIAAAGITWGASAHAQILFEMDYSSGAWPAAGWDRQGTEQYGTRWTAQRVAGAGPQGQDVAQLTELPGTGQHGWGWDGNVVPTWSANNSRFFRWRHKITGNLNSGSSNKLLIYQQGCDGGNCREIVQVNVLGGMIQYKVQQDGGDYQVESGYIYPLNTWLDVQVEFHSSSSTGANDGYTKLWINSDTYSSPTIQTGNMVFDAGGTTNFASNYVIFGGYNNSESVAQGSTNVQQLADFEIGTTFNSGWHVSGGANPPPPPPPPAPTPVPPPPAPTPTPSPTPPPGGTTQPTFTNLPSCASGTYTQGTINWTGSLDQYGGVWVDISPNANFSPSYNKYVEAYSTALTGFMSGSTPLTFSSGTAYYVRTYNGQHSATATLLVSTCVPTPPPPPPAPTPTPTPTPPPNPLPVGNFDEITSAGVVRGWSYDSSEPTVAITVQVFIDGAAGTGGTLLSGFATNVLRSDVNSTYGITGNHGFEYTIPQQYWNGVQHSIRVYGIDTTNSASSTLLTGSPRNFTLSVPTPPPPPPPAPTPSPTPVPPPPGPTPSPTPVPPPPAPTPSPTPVPPPPGPTPSPTPSPTPVPGPSPSPVPGPSPSPVPAPTPLPPNVRNVAPRGAFDEVRALDGVARGWSFDPNFTSNTNSVHFYINAPAGAGGTLAGSVNTSILRQDVNTVYSIIGNHGFEFRIPDQFRDGTRKPVYAYAVDTSDSTVATLLAGSPRYFTLTGGSTPTPSPTPTPNPTPGIPRDGTLVKGASSPAIYVVEFGRKRVIGSWNVFVGFGYQYKNVKVVDVSTIPDGTPLTDSRQRHVRGTAVLNKSTVYFMGTDQRYAFPSREVFAAWGYTFAEVVTATTYDLAVPEGPILTAP